ncbi:MAG: alpha/beta fold hydrolase [Deltaproteobacteria bacterium]|nr:alpha/beta fold hydrolase [Deltaproteobacteria bacterium]
MVNELYPFEGKVLDLDGLRYHYLDEGEGAPVVMVHGNPSWSFYYRDLVLALRGQYRTIVPDHIGCGRSDKPDDSRYEYTLERRVEDLGRLIDSLDIGKVTLVLHDWGGMIGMTWATQNPERIERLVLLNTSAFPLPESKPFPMQIALARTPGLGTVLVRGLNAFSKGAVKYCVTRTKMSKEVAAGYLEPYDSWENRIAVQRFVEDIPLSKAHPTWPLINATADKLEGLNGVPMLLLWGMKDFVFDVHFLDEWIRRFPDAEVHRFDDAGHYILEDAPEDVIPLVSTFLEAHPTA